MSVHPTGVFILQSAQSPSLVIASDANGNVEVQNESDTPLEAQQWQVIGTRSDGAAWHTLKNVQSDKYLNLKQPNDVLLTEMPLVWQLVSIDGQSFRIHEVKTQDTIHLVGDSIPRLELDQSSLSASEAWRFSQVRSRSSDSAVLHLAPSITPFGWLNLMLALNLWALAMK